MTSSRFTSALIALAALMLLAALMITAGGPGGLPTFASLSLPSIPIGGAADLLAARGSFDLMVGLVAGWLLRWLWGLPWGAVPRALLARIAGWRYNVGMAVLAVACFAVLVLY